MFKDRVPANSDPNELMEFVMARIRSSPLKLVDLKPDKPKSLGPYDCIALHLTLEGTYIQVHDLLRWVHHERRLLRVESLSLTPAQAGLKKEKEKGPVKLSIQLVLAGLMEKASPEKTAPGRRG